MGGLIGLIGFLGLLCGLVSILIPLRFIGIRTRPVGLLVAGLGGLFFLSGAVMVPVPQSRPSRSTPPPLSAAEVLPDMSRDGRLSHALDEIKVKLDADDLTAADAQLKDVTAELSALAARHPKNIHIEALIHDLHVLVADLAFAEAAHKRRGVSMANYLVLRNGMSYQDVVAVIGQPGTEQSSTSLGRITTIMYSWNAKGFGNMNAMFQDGKLVSKAQFGLR